MNERDKHTFLIRLTPRGVAINPDTMIPFSATNFPEGAIQFHPQTDVIWEACIHEYSRETHRVEVQITDYTPEDITAFETQTPKAPVASLSFRDLVWEEISPYLMSYRKAAIRHLLAEGTRETERPVVEQRTLDWHAFRETGEHHFTVHVSLDKVKFVTGGTLVRHTYQEHDLELFIPNNFILKEFELLKPFFIKSFGKKRITVKAHLSLLDGQVIDLNATSPEIEAIDERMIETVRSLQAKSIRNTLPPDVNKELFTADNFLDDDDHEGPDFDQAMRLMEILLSDEKIRNKQQILYLAGKLHEREQKILFTMQPHFGFVFTVQGAEHMHLVWELLNSHATYLWSYNPSEMSHVLAIRKLEYAIGVIRSQGRQMYRLEMERDAGVESLHFQVVRHEGIESHIADHFPLWRTRLHEKLY